MSNIRPANVFSGYLSDGTNITIPIASIPGLTAAEGHPTTGDTRELFRLIIEKIFTTIQALPAVDRPEFMVITRGSLVGLDSTTVRRSYQITFDEAVGATITQLKTET